MPNADPKAVETVLRSIQTEPAVKSAAWKAFFGSTSPAEFQSQFDSLALPAPAKAELWDLKFGASTPPLSPRGALAPQVAAPPPSGAPPAAPPPRRAAGKFGAEPKPDAPGWPKLDLGAVRAPLVDLSKGTPEPNEAITPYGKFAAGAQRGLIRAVSGLTSPENVGVIGAMKLAPKAISGLAGVYFTYEMAKALVDSMPTAKKAWEQKDWATLGEIVGGDALNALFVGAGARHVKGRLAGELKPVPTIEGPLADVPMSEAGRIRARAEAAPASASVPPVSQGERRATVEPPSTGRHQFPSTLVDPHIAALRGTAKRLGLDYETLSPEDRGALEGIQHDMNIGALANIAQPPPSWVPPAPKYPRTGGVKSTPPAEALPPVPQSPGPATAAEASPVIKPAAAPSAVGAAGPERGIDVSPKGVTIESGVPNAAEGLDASGVGQGAPVPEPRRPSNATWNGQATQVRVPGESTRYEAEYEIRELSDVYPSHHGETFQPNPDYLLKNDRNYADPANQERVVVNSRSGIFDPALLVTDNPTATNGPPVIDIEGNVLGGSNRVMILQRVYRANPEGASAYRQAMAEKAPQLGFEPGAVEMMNQPVLVRRVTGTDLDLQRAITDLNKKETADLTPAERALSESRMMKPEVADYLQSKIETAGTEATLNDALSGPQGAEIINHLVDSGVFTMQEKPALVDPITGALTAVAKDRIGKMMLGRLFRDSDQFERTPAELKNKLERVVAPLAKLGGMPEWDLRPKVQEAIDLLEYARAQGAKNLGDVVSQGSMFGEQTWSPEAIVIARKLQENPLNIVRAFRQYAQEAAQASKGEMLLGPTPTPIESFSAAFEAALPRVPGTAAKGK